MGCALRRAWLEAIVHVADRRLADGAGWDRIGFAPRVLITLVGRPPVLSHGDAGVSGWVIMSWCLVHGRVAVIYGR